MKKTDVKDGLLGLCVGDALGIPVKFLTKERLEADPVSGMIGYGIYNHPPGTWSDESSLCFCLAESLSNGLDEGDILDKYGRWFYEAYWTPSGKVFDISPIVYDAISHLKTAEEHPISRDESKGKNGAIISILPLAYYLEANSIENRERFKIIHQVAGIIHKEVLIGSAIYLQYTFNLIGGQGLARAYENMCKAVLEYYSDSPHNKNLDSYSKILEGEIDMLPDSELSDTGTFMYILEIGFRSLLTNHSYRDSVLAAINMGGETDVLGAMTGSLAGIYYGCESIPHNWLEHLVRHDDIIDLAEGMNRALFI